MWLKKILNQPYPFPEKTIFTHLWQSLVEGGGIALFFIILQPFGLSEWHSPNKTWVLLGYGIIVSICTAINHLLLPYLFPKVFHERNWVVWKEIIDIILLLILITIGNIIYTKLIFDNQFTSFNSIVGMFLTVVIIGSIPIGFGVMSNYIYQLKKYNQTIVVQHTESIDNQLVVEGNDFLKLFAENEKDSVEFSEKDLFFIESSDNYSTVFYEKNGKLQKELLRSSLTRLENQINSEKIVRCHRSFVVNLDKVEKVTGNAQGYKLHLQTPELFVPVARKYSDIVERFRS